MLTFEKDFSMDIDGYRYHGGLDPRDGLIFQIRQLDLDSGGIHQQGAEHQHQAEQEENTGKWSDIQLAAEYFCVTREFHIVTYSLFPNVSVTMLTISDEAFSMSSTMELTRLTR